MTVIVRAALFLSLWLVALPAQAAVTMVFWSHELGNSFPHAFFTLRGVPDAGGPAVDVNYGFTARTISPKILMGPVRGRLDVARPAYMRGSDAQFAVTLTDAQYSDVLALVAAWSENGGDSTYRLNSRNCVHFVQEGARRAGLTGLDHPGLMKKPRSFLKAVAAANIGRVTVIDQSGREYLASLPPLEAAPVSAAPVHTPPAHIAPPRDIPVF